MSEQKVLNAEYIYVTIPQDYLKVYLHIMAILADYGEEMLKDCKASCTDRNSGIIECFNMFNAAVAARNLGKDKLAETLIKYVESMLDLNYKDTVIPDNINFPVKEINADVLINFAQEERFKVVYANEVFIDGIEIIGDTNIEGISAEFTAILSPDNVTDTDLIWTIEQGSEFAYIDSTSGHLYIRNNAYHSHVVVRASSKHDPNIYNTKDIFCTYNNSISSGSVVLTVDNVLDFNNTIKRINISLVNIELNPIRFELYSIDNESNMNFVSQTIHNYFDVILDGTKNYIVKAIFNNGLEATSDILELYGVDPCYIGAANSYEFVINENNKITPAILDIGSPIGKEYPFTVSTDGLFLFIFVPVIAGHMNINEIRMDATNLLDGFDMEYVETDTTVNGKPYKQYKVDLNGRGFKADNYRLLITS